MNTRVKAIITYLATVKNYAFSYYRPSIVAALVFAGLYFFLSEAKQTIVTAHHDIKIIVWDFHDVIFEKKESTFSALWNSKKRRSLIKFGKTTKIMYKALKERFFNQNNTNIADVLAAAKEDNLEDFIQVIVNNETDCIAFQETIELIRLLHKLGYQQYLCSNMSDASLAILKKTQPELFGMFKGAFVTTSQSTRKPNTDFFKKFLETYKVSPAQVLFIDDKKENCKSAEKVGMRAVLFDPRKKAESIKKIRALLKIK